jgi:replicative DNA helicase
MLNENKKNYNVSALPANEEAEKGVLAAFLLDVSLYEKYCRDLKREDFYLSKNRFIFDALGKLYQKYRKVDIILLHEEILLLGAVSEAGGSDYIFSLQDNLTSLGFIDKYIEIVKEKSFLRETIRHAMNLVAECYSLSDVGVLRVAEQAEKMFFEISKRGVEKGFVPFDFCLKRVFDNLSVLKGDLAGITGVPSGFSGLDELTGGFQAGDFIVLAARPSMGKTALALCIARNASRFGVPVGIVSLEMSSDQLVLRILSFEARVRLSSLRSGQLNSDDWMRLAEGIGALSELKTFIDDGSMQTILELRTKCRQLYFEHGIRLLIIDYLQLLNTVKLHENRHYEISEISRFLKSLAKELNIPIIALSQLSRGVESRLDKRPVLSDLRDSGAIEQDADLIMFIYRDVVYNPETEFPDIAELIIGKQRNGPTGMVPLRWCREYTFFEGA